MDLERYFNFDPSWLESDSIPDNPVTVEIPKTRLIESDLERHSQLIAFYMISMFSDSVKSRFC